MWEVNKRREVGVESLRAERASHADPIKREIYHHRQLQRNRDKETLTKTDDTVRHIERQLDLLKTQKT